ncbi:Serine-threonine/tyrosine-protein kinase, catalytic domain [Dillenia turbinata]|uniref:Serine-threonine/tyrosine-protein kinase, catalytic domain n=1 Tax=Dillenia turbinata TaxID=194707 RepID=A0AAN8Z026_9MAGN
MALRIHVILLVMSLQIFNVAAYTNYIDSVALLALRSEWRNTPPNWVGRDPCGDNWVGIGCNNLRMTSITLSTMGLIGTLSSNIASLSELQTLDLSNNAGLSGSLTPCIANLTKLSILILDGCSFSGQNNWISKATDVSVAGLGDPCILTASIGNLVNLYWLDLTNNNLTGNFPVSDGRTPGLDLLVGTKHLFHSLFDSNQLTGSITSTRGLVQTLEVVRLDRNHLNGSVASNLSNLTHVGEQYLSNNVLTGPVPNLTGMNSLNYLRKSAVKYDMIPSQDRKLLHLANTLIFSIKQKLVFSCSIAHLLPLVNGTTLLQGYLDPEYNLTQELTVKSDIYSFGVVLLELITARSPIVQAKHVVHEVKTLMDKKQNLYDLYEILDPIIAGTSLGGLEQFEGLALCCVEESAGERPKMGEVVKEIENIMKLASVKPKGDSSFSSASYEEADKVNEHSYGNTNSFSYNAAFTPFKIEPL